MRAPLVLSLALLACAVLAIAVWTWVRAAPAGAVLPAGIPPGTPADRVRIPVPGNAADAAPAETEDPSAASAPVDAVVEQDLAAVAPQPENSLTGRVVDARGRPVEDAEVLLAERGASWPWPLAPGRALETRTQGEGRFRFEGVPPGDLRLAVRHAGHAPLELEELWQPPAGATDIGTAVLAPGLVIAGRVLAPDGSGVAGARIRTLGPCLPGDPADYNELAGLPLGVSGEGGEFRVTTGRGAWNLLVSSAAAQAPEVPRAFPEKLFTGTSTDEPEIVVELRLDPGSSLDGVVSTAGVLPAGLLVHALPALVLRHDELGDLQLPSAPYHRAGYRASAVRPDGTFEVQGLAAGAPYLLRVLPPGVALEAVDAFALWAEARAGAVGIELGYQPGATLELEVVDVSTGLPLDGFATRIDGGGPAAEHRGGRALLAEVRPSALRPDPLFEDVPEGADIGLAIDAPGYELEHLVIERLQPGQRVNLGRVPLVRLRALPVRVLDAESAAPLEGALVTLSEPIEWPDHRSSSSAETDREGRALATVPATDAQLRLGVTLARYRSHEEPLPPSVGCRAADLAACPVHEVRLARTSGSVRVRVQDPAGAAVPGARVLARASGTWDVRELATTDGEGRATLRDLEPGPWLLRAESAARLGGGEDPLDLAWVPVQVVLDAQVDVTLLADRLEVLAGSVFAGERALAGARLSLAAGAWSLREHVDASEPTATRVQRAAQDGGFRFERLLPGDYSLEIVDAASGVFTGRTVHVAPGQGLLVIDVEDTALVGHARDEHGRPLAGVEVFAYRALPRWAEQAEDLIVATGALLPGPDLGQAPIARALTDSAGRFVMRALPPDDELALVFQWGALSAVRAARARQSELVDGVDAVLVPEARLALELAGPLHGGIQRLGLLGRRIDAPLGTPGIALVVDEPPAAETFTLPPGRWRLRLFELDPWERVARIGPHHDLLLEPGGEGSARLSMP